MVATKVKRRRDKLSPRPILDKKLLLAELGSREIKLSELQLATFYQLLHRCHYPDLKTFVQQYYNNEDGSSSKGQATYSDIPTRNPVSSKKKNLGRQLPRAFLDFLDDDNNDFVTITSCVQSKPTSKDGTTTKMAVQLQDGHFIECVLMRHVSEKGSRATVCVSSQVGCAMGCTFCATGTMGIRGDLCTGEILEQLVHAGRILEEETRKRLSQNMDGVIISASGSKKKVNEISLDFVRNVVFMGMGEPLNNYDNVIEACKGMIDRRRWNMAHGRVTVSTVGVTPKMRKLTHELPEVNLALSLHAPNQPMREAIVPTAKMYPIEDMVEALDEHMLALEMSKGNGMIGVEQRKSASKRKRAMIEYVMLEGDTSSFECAHQLGKLCENRHLVVNLIPYNQTDVKDRLHCPSETHMKEFQRIVTSYGSFCFIRRTMGADIAGACGQLVVMNEKKSAQPMDIEDGPFIRKKIEQKSMKGRVLQKNKNNVDSSRKNNTDMSGGVDMDKWIRPLAFATTIAASCFAVSIVVLLSKRRK
mmetsp:Transcript_24856/g.28734  ORF Transcript_24856/g.28734 Transcript_24856/m.28734 type:complete len:531 (+) Transcript_24856:47-1639(+)